MTRGGIVRAADRFAIWREAAEPAFPEEEAKYGPKPEPPTSAPPPGVTPAGPGPEEAAPVVVPNTNKFKYPANALGKILDTALTPGAYVPQHQHPGVKAYLDTPAGQGFSKTYLKPQYQEALKAHLGEESYTKLLHHMPEEHHQALTTHTQKPAPNSNKYKQPTNALKKLLADPNTTPEKVNAWKAVNPSYTKTYLHNPAYQQALKDDIGAKGYDAWQEHLHPGKEPKEKPLPKSKAEQVTESAEKAFAPAGFVPKSQEQFFEEHGAPKPKQGLGDKLHAAHPSFDPDVWNNLSPEKAGPALQKYIQGTAPGFTGVAENPEAKAALQQVYDEHFGQPAALKEGPISGPMASYHSMLDAAEAHPEVTGEQMKMFKSPEFVKWFATKPTISQKKWAQDPTSAVGYFKQDTGHGQEPGDQDDIEAIQKLLEPTVPGAQQPDIGEPDLDAVQEALGQPAQDLTDNHKNLLQFTKDNPEWAAQHGETLQSPEFKQWFESQPQHYQDSSVLSPSQTMNDFANDQDEIGAIKEQMPPSWQPGQKGNLMGQLSKVPGLFNEMQGNDSWESPAGAQQALKKVIQKYDQGGALQAHVPALQQIYDEHFGEQPWQQKAPPAKQKAPGVGPQFHPVEDILKAVPPSSTAGQYFHGPGFKDWYQQYQDEGGKPGGLGQLLSKFKEHLNESGYAVEQPSPEAQAYYDQYTEGGGDEAAQHQALAEGIKKIFPNSSIAEFPDDFSVPEMKKQLEGWSTHLDHPDHAKQVKAIKDLYDQHFGPGAMQAQPSGYPSDTELDAAGITPEAPAPSAPHILPSGKTWGQQAVEALGSGSSGYLDAKSPEEKKVFLDYWAKSEGLKSHNHPDLLKLYDHPDMQQPGQKSQQQSEVEPADLGYGDEAYTTEKTPTVQGPEFNDWWQDLSLHEKLYYEKHPEEAQQDFQAGSKGPTHDTNLQDLAELMGSYQGGHSYVTNVPDYQAWEKGLSKEQAQQFVSDPAAAKQDFEKYLTQHDYSGDVSPEDEDEIAKMQQQIGGDPWGPEPESTGDPWAATSSGGVGDQLKAILGEDVSPGLVIAWNQMDPSAAQAGLKNLIKVNPEQAQALQQLHDSLDWEQQLLPQPTKPEPAPFDPKALAKELGPLVGISPVTMTSKHGPWTGLSYDQAKQELAEVAQSFDDKPAVKALYDKYFGGDGGGAGDPATMKADFAKIIPGHKWNFSTPEQVDEFKSIVGEVLDPDYDPTAYGADEYVNTPEKVQEVKAFWDKHFGGGAPAGGGGLTPDLLKQHFPNISEQTLEKWLQGGDPEKQKAYIQEGISQFAENGSPTAKKWQEIYDKVFGGGEEPLFGDGATGSGQGLDVDGLNKDLADIYGEGNLVPFSSDQDPQHIKEELEGAGWLGDQGDSDDNLNQLQAVYDKHFGGGAPAGGGGLTPDLLKKYFPSLPSDSVENWLQGGDPAKQKKMIEKNLDNGLMAEETKAKWHAILDQAFGGGTASLPGGFNPTPGGPTPTKEQLLAIGVDPHNAITISNQTPEHFWQSWDKIKGKQAELGDKFDASGNYPPSHTWNKIMTAWGGGGAAGAAPQTVGQKLKALYPEMKSTAEKLDAQLKEKSPEQIKNMFDNTAKSYPNLAEGLQKIYDESFGGGGAPTAAGMPPLSWLKKHFPNNSTIQAWGGSGATHDEGYEGWIAHHQDKLSGDPGNAPSVLSDWMTDKYGDKDQYGGAAAAPPEFDWDEFGPAFKEIYPKSEWASGSDPGAESAKKKLQDAVVKANVSYPDSPKTQAANELYKKWFGPVNASSAPAPTWGGGGNQPAQPQYQEPPPPPPEPEEEDGISAPAKSEQPDPEVLAELTGANGVVVKPTVPSDWKDFAAWWGKTILTPEQEQAIYSAWFPNKNPEKASGWFQQVYDHYSKPSTGDLTAQGMPAWATASWALGKNAEQDWPVFQQWAGKDAGIPKGLGVKQKLAIWNGLNDADKAEIAENYTPANPVDKDFVVDALQKAFPDSDFLKWTKMPQGTLKTNVEMLAKSGYDEAIPIFNQFFGGNIPVPEPKEEKAKPEAFEMKLVPPSQLPQWVKDHWGDTDAEAKKYTEFKHFADSIGAGDLVEQDYQSPLITMWNQLPPHLKTQVNAMAVPPWHDPDQFTEWVNAQPKIGDQLNAILGDTGYDYTNDYTFNKPTNASYSSNQARKLGKLIEDQSDPAKQQALLGIYHYYFGNGKATLSQSLSAIYPDEDWDKFLKANPTKKVMSNLVKRMKTEQDPEKWIQVVNAWNKYFPHPDFTNKPAPTGIKEVSAHLKDYTNPGQSMNPNYLKSLKYWKEVKGGQAGTSVPYYSHLPDDYDPGPYIKSLLATKDEGGYPAYHGWTAPGAAAVGEGFKSDPAMLGSTGPTYAAPAAEAKGKQYETLVETATQHKADTPSGGGLSIKDLGVLKSEEFQHWFSHSSKGYQSAYQHNPGVALDDFKEFMAGGAAYGEVPGGAGGKQKPYDLSPQALQHKLHGPYSKGLPHSQTANPPKSEKITFPEVPPTPGQETLPLGPGEQFAAQTAPLPIYRLMRLKLDEEPQAPSWVKGSKAREQHVQQQKARLRRVDEIVNGKATARKHQDDLNDFQHFVSQHHIDPDEAARLGAAFFPPEQEDMFSDDKWAYFEDFAKAHHIDPGEMHDLAKKMEVMPPPKEKGNYDHPELAQLILDYLENGGGAGGSGLGTHWTRDLDKAYYGFPESGGVFGEQKMRSLPRQIPLLMHGLWSGQGETSDFEGGAYPVFDDREREQNLDSNAPVLVHRLQIRSPESPDPLPGSHLVHNSRDDWRDVMDHIPLSLLPPGPNETASTSSYGKNPLGKTPKDLIRDKPSLAQALQDTLGGGARKTESNWDFAKSDWDHLKPGYQADMKFNELVGKLGPHPEITHPKELARIRRIYQEFFVGQPNMPLKPHIRRASLQRVARFNDAEYRQHVTDLDAALKDSFAREQDSRHLHGTPWGEGQSQTRWTRDRLKQQRKAVERAWQELGGDDIPREGRAMMLAGGPGSGKGSLYRHPSLGLQNYLRIDPDHMKHIMAKEGMIPTIEGFSPMESSALAHKEASDLVTQLAERAYHHGTNVVWDTTMNNHHATSKTIDRMREMGYHTIDGALVNTDHDIARQRAEQRHRADEDDYRDGVGEGGGRWVPQEVSRANSYVTPGSRYKSRPEEVFHAHRPKFDNVAVFDGNTSPAPTLTHAEGPDWGDTDPTPADIPAPMTTTAAALDRSSVRGLMEAYERGELPFEKLVSGLAVADHTHKPSARNLAEHYHQAQEPPDDNDFFWVESAHRNGTINDAQHQAITDAIDARYDQGGNNRLAVVENEIRILEATPWYSKSGDPVYDIPVSELKQYRQRGITPGIETPQQMYHSLWEKAYDNGEMKQVRKYDTSGSGNPGGSSEGSGEERLAEGFETGAKFPPVEIVTNGTTAEMGDGNHRVNMADVFSQPSLSSYISYQPQAAHSGHPVDPNTELGRQIHKLVQNHPYQPISEKPTKAIFGEPKHVSGNHWESEKIGERPDTRFVYRKHPDTGEWQQGKIDESSLPRSTAAGTHHDVDFGNGPEPVHERQLYARNSLAEVEARIERLAQGL